MTGLNGLGLNGTGPFDSAWAIRPVACHGEVKDEAGPSVLAFALRLVPCVLRFPAGTDSMRRCEEALSNVERADE